MPLHFVCRGVTCRGKLALADGATTTGLRCPICRGQVRRDFNPVHNKIDWDAQESQVKRQTIRSVRGRSNSAPALADADDLPTVTGGHVSYVPDLSDPSWTAASNKIRLPFHHLVSMAETPLQGIIIDDPHLVIAGRLLSHFQQITATMANPTCSGKNATEATGEAAAALAMLKSVQFAGHTMLSGFGNHAGPGVDQVWGKAKTAVPGTYEAYVIVEAKGVGQMLEENAFSFEDYGTQMSKGWVLDRLGRMCNSGDPISVAVATQLVIDVGLSLDQTVPLGGGDKSFWKEKSGHGRGTGKASLRGIVYTADWTGTTLGWKTSHDVVYFPAT